MTGPTPALLAAATGLHADPLRLIFESGLVAQLVLLTLFGFSAMSWAVMIGRHRFLKRVERSSDALVRELGSDRRLTQLNDIATRHASSPLALVLHNGVRELIAAVNDGVAAQRSGAITPEQARERALLRARRRAEDAAAAQIDTLDRHLGILATTGTVTPFIGLFGTVWGIMNAFQGIGLTGSASLAAVAPGISEALVTTAAGLLAAIPAVIGYNVLLARVRRMAARLERFVPQFLSLAEAQLDQNRPAAAPLEAGRTRS